MADVTGDGGRARTFRSATEAAEELVGSLEGLREEAGSYAESSRQLEDARAALAALADAVKETGERTQRALEVLEEVGVPEVQRQLGELSAAVRALSEELPRDLAEGRGKLDAVGEQVGQLSEGLARDLAEGRGRLDAVGEQVGQLSSQMRTLNDDIARRQRQHLYAIAAVGVLAVVAIVLSLV